MKFHPISLPWRRTRGSAFVTVLLFTFLLLTLVASILNWSLSERKMNIRASYWLEARNAAEAVAEYGFAQINTQFSSHANPPSFDPGGTSPLNLPPTHSPMLTTDFFYGSHVDPTSLELIGGIAQSVPSSGALYFVDPNDPNNANDTLKGQYVYRRDVQVLAKATVLPPNGDTPVSAYVTETVSVRGAPLFANAIFYSNNDLEASPGPTLDIRGPVHVNGNLILSAQGTVETGTANYISFYGAVSASGDLYHAWGNVNRVAEGRGYDSSQGDGLGERLGSDPLNFVNSAGTLVNLKDSTTSTWRDSTLGTDNTLFDANGRYYSTATDALTQLQGKLSASFRQTASQTWSGNVQTEAMGVAAYNPVGATGQVGVDGSGNPILANTYAADPLGYGPHAMIDPPNTTLSSGDPYYAAKQEVEQQKYSEQAALYVQVVVTPGDQVPPTSGGGPGTPDRAVVNLYSWPGSAAAAGVTDPARIGPNGGLLLGTVPSGLVSFIPYQATVPNSTVTAPATQTSYSATGSGTVWHIKTTTKTGGTLTTSNVTLTYNGSGTSAASGGTLSFSGGSSSSSTGAATYTSSSAALLAAPGGGATTYTTTGASTTTPGATSGATVSSGVYDQRQLAGVNLVQIDMSALRLALNDTNTGTRDANAILDASGNVWGNGSSDGYSPLVSGSTGWNGGIYVQVAKSDGTTAGQTSVAVANAKVASGSSLVPTVNSTVSGLSLATNAPLYVLGNFNSDGNNATTSGSATTPDDGKTDAQGTPLSAEVPVALAADAITILSPNYFQTAGTYGSAAPTTNTSSTSAYSSWKTASPSASGNTEVAAAFITGITPTSSTAFSGGVHNLPRFLENWGSNTVAIRGSLVCMYQSKIATGSWAQRYYSAPKRNWGFDVIFQNGHFPPLSPKVMSYRRVDFSDLSLNDTVRGGVTVKGYDTLRHQLWPSSF